MSEKLATWLVAGFLVVCFAGIGAAIFMPSFSQTGGATILTVILGAFVSLLGGAAVGTGLTRQIKHEDSKERSSEDER